jgi:hypothetical protein
LNRQIKIAGILFFCFTLAGCIGVTPSPKRTRTPQGIEEKTVDLTFIQPGQTTRAEVKDKLKLIDTSYQSNHYFLGRWSSSSSGGWAFLVGYTGAGGGAARFWKSGSLLVEFDEVGVVRKSETFSDSKLLQKLTPVAVSHVSATNPLEFAVKYWRVVGNNQAVPARIVLSPSTFKFEELGTSKKPHKFVLPAQEFLRVSKSIMGQPDPVYATQTMHFARDLKPLGGPKGKTLQVDVSLPELVALLSYVSHSSKVSSE